MTVSGKVIKELMKPDKLFEVKDSFSIIDEINDYYYDIKNVDIKHRQGISKIINFTYPPIIEYHTFGYKEGEHGRIYSVDGIFMGEDSLKHVYACKQCGAIYRSKNARISSGLATHVAKPVCMNINILLAEVGRI